ncbi:hypothetical protein [Methylobacterium pseudosasicola]|uniref:Uncharacterized protein n=1 Tax=Methylobacterium pseudosasicola TaxID=582667 RepID=A0A1I4GTV0_9HYPH|nr:hypothetical protein [Methylobacterium pseudosasicola]SFL33448.1 hypothetical protein SAMN05192568_1003237 [Methylobacterium pseudosasicola]
MTGRSLLDPAAENEAPRIYEAGLGVFRQRLASAERNGSRILLHGGRVD